MNVQRNNLKLITIISFSLSTVCLVTAIVKYTVLLLIIASYLMIVSLIADGLLLHFTFQKQNGILQLGRGIILLFIITLLIIQLFRS